MNKLFKRFIAITLTVGLIFTLAACSGTDTGKDGKAATGNTAEQTVKPEDKVVEINWVSANYTPIDDSAILKKKIEKDFNVKLNVIFIDQNNYTDVMGLKFASNEIPDFFWAPGADLYSQWSREGLLEEITEDEIRQHGPVIASGVDEMVEKYNKYLWDIGIVDGKRYSFPSIWMDGLYHDPIVWRNDWLKNVGIDKIPETIDEAEAAFYKFAKEDPNKNGKKDTYGLSTNGMYAIWGSSGYIPWYWSLKDGQVVYGALQPEIKDMVARFAKWYKDGVLDPEYVTGENQGGYWAVSHSFANGRIGLTCKGYYYHWVDNEGSNAKAFKEINPNGTFAFGKPIKGVDGKSGMAVSGVTSTAYNCFRKGLKKEKIYKVLEVISGMNKDKDTFMSYYFGEKGKHWDYNAKGEPDWKPEWVKQSAALGSGSTFFMWGNPHKSEWLMSDKTKAWVDENFSYPGYTNTVFVTLPSESKLKAEADKIYDETVTDIITGKKGIEAWDPMIKKIKETCYDQLTKEANEWYTSVNKNSKLTLLADLMCKKYCTNANRDDHWSSLSLYINPHLYLLRI